MRYHARHLALPLALALALSPAAQALTVDQARELLTENYIDPIPHEVLELDDLQAMVEAVGDPYTYYFTPEEYQVFTSSMEDAKLVGVGISSVVTEEGLLLQRVYEGTPAEEGGLRAGDLLIAVDGRSAVGEDADLVSSWIRGEEGTQVELTYRRDGKEHTVTLTRKSIVLPATYSELREGDIGYLDCDTFGGETVEHFRDGLSTYSQADHWLVDLRGNGGGDVRAAIQATNCFTGPGALAYLRDASGAYEAYGSSDKALTDAPVIVLTDENTASASELFASGIRDTGVGLVVGDRTFGKGIAQVVFDQNALPDYFPDGDALKITAFRYFAPSGATTDTVGVIPHLLVAPALAPDVASLLCADAPGSDPSGLLRIDFNGLWYVDVEEALAHEDAFTALLEALPATVQVMEGDENGWLETTAATLAQKYGLDGYERRGFTDTADARFGTQIDLLGTYFVVAGTGNGTFDPQGQLTRAQLCALLAQALQCRVPAGESAFSDVDPDAWYAPAVNAIAKLGLVSGVGGGRFDPDAPVSHEQFLTIMGRLAQRLDMTMDLGMRDLDTSVLDDPALAPWASWSRSSAWLLAMSQRTDSGNTLSLLWDPLEAIDPAATTTREEAAALTYTVLSYLNILPV